MKNFKDKNVWITGASSGIGEEMARQAHVLGANVLLSARNAQALESIKSSLAGPAKAWVLPLDMEASESFDDKVKEALKLCGRIDLLFNNAGVSQRATAAQTTLEVDRKLMDINYFGTVALTKALLPFLRKQKESHVAVNSSLAGKFGFYQRSAYSASKFALHGFFETLRLEEEKHGLKVTMLCPEGVRTAISQHALTGHGRPFGKKSDLQEQGMPVNECVKKMIAAIENEDLETVIAQGPAKFSVTVKALFPNLFLKMLKRKEPR